MEQVTPIKVVWLCHFSNSTIRSKLKLSNLRIENFIRQLLGKKKKSISSDFAPWVTNLIKEFEGFNKVEVHIVAPHKGLKRFTQEFNLNGINYHFYKPELPFMLSKVGDKIIKGKKQYRLNRFFIKRFIKQINPDIVNLIGTENPYYSIGALDIEDIPVYVSAQTVYSNPSRMALTGNVQQDRWDLELQIHQKVRYYGCTGRMHRDLIIKNNPKAIIFKMFFPIEYPHEVKEVPKEYDFVFFAAGVTKKKGIEDAIDALSKVKEHYPNVKLNVVGKCEDSYKEFLNTKIAKLNLQENISFNSYFPVHSHMHQHIKKSRFALLPVKLDIISGTIVEAMLLELPLVTYKTTGTPFLNKDGETVLLGDIDDIDTLAKNMLTFLNNPSFADGLALKAKAFIEKEFNNTTNAKRLVANYRAVINHYHNNTPIPKELLFSTNEFPKY